MTGGYVVWFTGLSGAGKSTVSALVGEELRRRRARVEILDGDEVRVHLSAGLGFSREDRDRNVGRIAFVAGLLSRHGIGVLTAAISPYRAAREAVRASVPNFVEVFVDAPVSVCAARDVKGLYAKAYAGEIDAFTGVSDPYEPPPAPELHLRTDREAPEESAARVVRWLEERSLVPPLPAIAPV